MRIILNSLSSSGSKTGVGHYTTELVRALTAQQASDDFLDLFPRNWLRRVNALGRAGPAWVAAAPRAARRSPALRPRQHPQVLGPGVAIS